MAKGIELATAYISLAIESSDISKTIGAQFGDVERRVAPKAGKNIGAAMAKGFEAEAPDLSRLERDFEDAQKRIVQAEERATTEQENLARKVEIAQQKKAEAVEKYGEESSQALTAIDRLIIAEQKLEAATMKAEDEQRKLNKALEDSETALKGARDEAGRLDEATSKVGGFGDAVAKALKGDFKGSFDTLRDEAEDTAGRVRTSFENVGSRVQMALKGDLKGAFASTKGDASEAADDVEKEFEQAGADSATGFGNMFAAVFAGGAVLSAAEAAASSITDTFSDAFSGAIDADRTSNMLEVQLGLDPAEAERAGKIAGSLYRSGWGESLEETTQAVSTVMSSIEGLGDLSEDELFGAAENALMLSEAFGIDVAQAAQVAGQAVSLGLADTADEAFDLMTVSMQRIPENLRGEMMDAVSEYGPHLANLGYEGEEAFGLLASAPELGQYGIDKVGDALKEFSIRSTDMSAASTEAYEAIGLNADEMANRILAGGDTAAEATAEIVDGLLAIEDPAEQAEAAIALFGTPIEDLGVQGIPDFLESLDGSSEALGETQDAAFEAATTLGDDLGTKMESAKRSAVGFFSDGLHGLISGLQDGKSSGEGFAGAMSTMGATARTVWDNNLSPLFEGLQSALTVVKDMAVEFFDQTLSPILSDLGDQATKLWEGFLKPVFESIVSVIQERVIPTVTNLWENVVKPAFEEIGEVISLAWNNVILPVFNALTSFINTVVGPVIIWLWENIVGPAFTAIGDIITAAWNNVIKPIFDTVQAVLRGDLSGAFTSFKDAVGGVFETIGAVISAAWNNVIKPIFDKLGSWLSDHVLPGIQGGVDAIGDAWNSLKSFFATPINWIIDYVINGAVRTVVNTVANALGLDWEMAKVGRIEANPNSRPRTFKPGPNTGGGLTSVQARAEGGYTPPGWTLVGEEGPELINFARPGRVYTAAETAEAFALAGSRATPDQAGRGYEAVTSQDPILLGQAAGAHPAQAVLPMGDQSVWDRIGGTWSNLWRGTWSAVKTVAGKAIEFVRGALGEAAALALNPVKGTIRSMVPIPFIRDGFINQLDKIVDWVKGVDRGEGFVGGTPVRDAMAPILEELEIQQFTDTPLEGLGAMLSGLSGGGSSRPVAGGRLTSLFGPRWGGIHAGVDFAVPTGTPIRAWRPGVVTGAGWNTLAGRTGIGVLLAHAAGFGSYYGHMSRALVNRGQTVSAGQLLGLSGNTGNSTGPHLHFEISKGGPQRPVNPLPYLHDEGGWLEPGVTQVANLTRKPEAILSPSQWDLAEKAIVSHVNSDGVVVVNVYDVDGVLIGTMDGRVEKGFERAGRY